MENIQRVLGTLRVQINLDLVLKKLSRIYCASVSVDFNSNYLNSVGKTVESQDTMYFEKNIWFNAHYVKWYSFKQRNCSKVFNFLNL